MPDSNIAIIVKDIELILSLCTFTEREFILNHLILKLNQEKNERKKESVQNS
jgi:hypothetical protein